MPVPPGQGGFFGKNEMMHKFHAKYPSIVVQKDEEEFEEKILTKALKCTIIIMECMKEAISEPRAEISPNAPRLLSMTIPQEDIGTVIGPGGKNIRGIIEASGAEIDIQDDGKVTITSNDKDGAELAKKMIQDLTFKAEVGMICKGKVVRIIPIGAFVELAPGVDALLHVSQISKDHVEKPADALTVGQEVEAKVVDFNVEEKKISLSIKALFAPEEPEAVEDDADVADVNIEEVASAIEE